MKLSDLYQWEVETADHQVIRQYNGDGTENPSTLIPADQVVRASILSRAGAARHDILLDHSKGDRFIRRFGRGIMKNVDGRYTLAEYLHCIQTIRYRLWVYSSTGQSLVTDSEFELYL